MSHDPLVFHEQGDANEYCLVTEGGKWVISFRMNGEMLTARQIEIGRRMVACFNACAGMTDEQISHGLVSASVLSYVVDQRDELLAALELLATYPTHRDAEMSAEGMRKYARAAIAAAKGEK